MEGVQVVNASRQHQQALAGTPEFNEASARVPASSGGSRQ